MAKVFIAKFGGTKCPECGDEIKEGEEVSYAVDLLLHAECNENSFYDDREFFGDR